MYLRIKESHRLHTTMQASKQLPPYWKSHISNQSTTPLCSNQYAETMAWNSSRRHHDPRPKILGFTTSSDAYVLDVLFTKWHYFNNFMYSSTVVLWSRKFCSVLNKSYFDFSLESLIKNIDFFIVCSLQKQRTDLLIVYLFSILMRSRLKILASSIFAIRLGIQLLIKSSENVWRGVSQQST